MYYNYQEARSSKAVLAGVILTPDTGGRAMVTGTHSLRKGQTLPPLLVPIIKLTQVSTTIAGLYLLMFARNNSIFKILMFSSLSYFMHELILTMVVNKI